MKIVYLGDVVAHSGRDAVLNSIKYLKEHFAYQVLIVNIDNAAHGFGCTSKICEQFLRAGVTAFVTGDHVWNQKEFLPFLDECKRIVRPLNYADNLPGVGFREIPLDNGQRLLLMEVVGRVFMENVENPLIVTEKALKNYTLSKNIDAIVIDIHAEATAEKQSLARYFDGRVSAIIGSHTHVPTADAVILPKGTAYQTDAGMCGDYNSVIGFEIQAPIERLKNEASSRRLEPALGIGTICGTFIETNDKTGLATRIEAIKFTP